MTDRTTGRVVLREEMPDLSRQMTRIADESGDWLVDVFAGAPLTCLAVKREHGGGPYRWDANRMLWEEQPLPEGDDE